MTDPRRGNHGAEDDRPTEQRRSLLARLGAGLSALGTRSNGRTGDLFCLGPVVQTERLTLRPAKQGDFEPWREARRRSMAHLVPWEPAWSVDHLTVSAFRRRVAWSTAEIRAGRAYPLLIFRNGRGGGDLVGGVTIEHVRRGAAQSAALGYWLSVDQTGRGYMTEALDGLISHAFDQLDLSRLEAACVPHNFRSRTVLERVGFHVEGLARGYLQINGTWQNHILYERRRQDRLG